MRRPAPWLPRGLRGIVPAGYLLTALAGLAVAAPVAAREAAIETTAALRDHSDDAVTAAVREAVTTAVRGAVAMGLPWVRLRDATVSEDRVTVLIVATDVEPDEDEAEREADLPQPTRIDL
jgi:hypothetical protein